MASADATDADETSRFRALEEHPKLEALLAFEPKSGEGGFFQSQANVFPLFFIGIGVLMYLGFRVAPPPFSYVPLLFVGAGAVLFGLRVLAHVRRPRAQIERWPALLVAVERGAGAKQPARVQLRTAQGEELELETDARAAARLEEGAMGVAYAIEARLLLFRRVSV